MKSSKESLIVVHSTTARTCQEAVELWISEHPGWSLANEPWAVMLNVTEVSVISPSGEIETLDCYPVNEHNNWIKLIPEGHWLVSLDSCYEDEDEVKYRHSGQTIRRISWI